MKVNAKLLFWFCAVSNRSAINLIKNSYRFVFLWRTVAVIAPTNFYFFFYRRTFVLCQCLLFFTIFPASFFCVSNHSSFLISCRVATVWESPKFFFRSSSPFSKILVSRLSTVDLMDYSRLPKQNFLTLLRLASDNDAEPYFKKLQLRSRSCEKRELRSCVAFPVAPQPWF